MSSWRTVRVHFHFIGCDRIPIDACGRQTSWLMLESTQAMACPVPPMVDVRSLALRVRQAIVSRRGRVFPILISMIGIAPGVNTSFLLDYCLNICTCPLRKWCDRTDVWSYRRQDLQIVHRGDWPSVAPITLGCQCSCWRSCPTFVRRRSPHGGQSSGY